MEKNFKSDSYSIRSLNAHGSALYFRSLQSLKPNTELKHGGHESVCLHVLCNRSCRMFNLFCVVLCLARRTFYCKTPLIVSATKRSKAISSERMSVFTTKRFCCFFTRLRVVKLVDNGNMAQSKIVFVCKLTSASCSRFVLKLEHSLITLLTINVFHLFKQKVTRDNLTDIFVKTSGKSK